MNKKTHDLTIFCLQEIHIRIKVSNRFKTNKWKRYFMQTITKRELQYISIRQNRLSDKVITKDKENST